MEDIYLMYAMSNIQIYVCNVDDLSEYHSGGT